jgi:predicted cobalt transporter CbtA
MSNIEKAYIGSKIVRAVPMSREFWEIYQQSIEGKRDIPVQLHSLNQTPGYKVIYENDYESWSPADVFDRSYRVVIKKEKGLAYPYRMSSIEKVYIGSKIIGARPMSKEFWEIYKKAKEENKVVTPDMRDANVTPGYKVRYEDGYESWSPADVFDRSYRVITEKEKALIG